jgi:hypothetical protein
MLHLLPRVFEEQVSGVDRFEWNVFTSLETNHLPSNLFNFMLSRRFGVI